MNLVLCSYRRSLRKALAIHASGGDAWREGLALRELGRAYREMGRLRDAAEAMERAAALLADTGDRYDRAGVLEALGRVLTELGEAEDAERCWRESLRIYEQLDLPEAVDVRLLLSGAEER